MHYQTLLTLTLGASALAARPNIILIITDDQDVRTNTLSFMPKLQSLVAEQGTTFNRFHAPVSLCCPSRVSLLTGQYAHNHNVTFVSGPFGGYRTFCEKGYSGESLSDFLQDAGYATYYTGKLMNGLTFPAITACPTTGWTSSDFLIDPNVYLYYNSSFSANGEPVVNHLGEYQVDVIEQKASSFLQDAISGLNSSTPFFLGIAPTAPHLEVQFNGSFTEPLPAPGDEDLFEGIPVPENPNFNVQGGVSWVKSMPELNETVIEYFDHLYRQRLRALQSVDSLVESIVQQVEDAGIADNTYIIYVADNGYALGSHRRQPGKCLPFQEDVIVPFLVRGPGIPTNLTNDQVYSMPDLTATILDIANASASYPIDGRVIAFTESEQVCVQDSSQEIEGAPAQTIVEYWNGALEEGTYAFEGSNGVRDNTTYRSIQAIDGDEQDWVYGVWCTGERELYDLKTDPWQINNLATNTASGFDSFEFSSNTSSQVASRLDALLIVLKTCIGEVCRDPWKAIFPNQTVSSLSDALSSDFDEYFTSLPKFRYEKCQFGYFDNLESPKWNESLAFV
ncbi:alkaline phosphatase-like protein [Dendrothele bispora CBS 962.96]|uniref:Alkaline phosphatase-like protein n=1 Tax=Dendrothele bispora (strain CBS 962.96) TaxID=1314807 RepID=A0A4S8LI52_DENBC|nr:alkaline phosphatase-like protein [Dendrothele bispora CBS 962.96]